MASIHGQDAFIPLQYSRMPEQDMCREAQAFYQRMKTRRSVRDFSADPIPRAVIEQALRTAGTAPSGANKQPWHFAVVTDPAVKREIRLAAEAEEREFYERRASDEWLKDLAPLGTDDQKPFLETAPCLIGVFLQKFNPGDDGGKHKNYYTSESVGLATGMLISALHLSGLATLTHTPSPMKFLNRILKRPDDERPFLLLVVGYPAEGVKVPNISRYELEHTCSFFD
ncbi:nitroreductase family protein [Simiduia agarivorans]|uniref:Nitroreductase n=1 Tax=Simiduia agarivorans (strain DSM 21679 / JCM 13881 / BCRC 17597 / SA1) TaxID=1117647 RepID=K4L2Z8_SIMAS|nr:nitroreductase family protein [Simiduia agarivorans]AFV00573.1 nitroreductase [Simiduia agarivorans SA1 = DSM 21679]